MADSPRDRRVSPRLLLSAAVALALAAVWACERQPPAPSTPAAPKELRVVVTIPPLRGIVEPLLSEAGVKYRIETLIPPGASEHGYEIPPSKLADLDRADVVVLVGLGLEPQVEKFLEQHERKGRRSLVLAEALGIKAVHGEEEHGHEEGEDEHHHASDPHIWLDPVLVGRMVGACADTLRASVGADSESGKKITLAQAVVARRVAAVDDAYKATFAKVNRRTIVVGHDAWGYLARRYNLETVPVKGLTNAEPTPASMEAASKAVKDKGVTVIFVEPQTSPDAARRIASATGAKVRTLDPLGDGDWFKLMETNLKELAAALGVETRAGPKKD